MADTHIGGNIKRRVLTVIVAQSDDVTVDEFLNSPKWISGHRRSVVNYGGKGLDSG